MEIKWGIIGCGDVTEIKSGPAFNKVNGSSLVGVMRRDIAKARDYAARHGVPGYYGDALALINDPNVNAIYVATPPDSHAQYTIEAFKAGKPVYVEKPMALSEKECLEMIDAARTHNVKFTVAHYRRALPMFNKVKELIENIGDVRFISIQFLQPPQSTLVATTDAQWRLIPAISGGGLFHDMAPHHLDLMLYFFGDPIMFSGHSANQAKLSQADDIVSGNIVFRDEIVCKGLWCFNVPIEETKDVCEIIGSTGKIVFPFHGNFCKLIKGGKTETFDFSNPQHIQQPMIEQVVNYFSGRSEINPCDPTEGAKVMQIMDAFTKKQ